MEPSATHRDLCRAAAQWMLKLEWCDLACWELGGYRTTTSQAMWDRRALRRQAMSWPQRDADDVAHPLESAAVVDAVGLMTPTRHDELRARAARNHRKAPAPRVQAVECKRTRSDLLGDLRSGKLLKYERLATHCCLAALPAAFGSDDQLHKGSAAAHAVLADLEARGLPRTWGVVSMSPWVYEPSGTLHFNVQTLRNPRRLPTQITLHDRNEIVRTIARSLVFRVLGGGPMTEAAP